MCRNEIAALFEPSVEAAVVSIKAQINASRGVVKSVWLVGGFAASPWLFTQLQERLAPLGIVVSRPDSQTSVAALYTFLQITPLNSHLYDLRSKAVADGAIGFYCDHHVAARMSKFMYGVEYLREFDPQDPDHVARKDRLCELPSGPRLLADAFDCILARVRTSFPHHKAHRLKVARQLRVHKHRASVSKSRPSSAASTAPKSHLSPLSPSSRSKSGASAVETPSRSGLNARRRTSLRCASSRPI